MRREYKPGMVVPNDVFKAGFCKDGLRDGCRIHGLDIRALIMGDGLPIADLEKIEDDNIQRVVAAAKAREAKGKE